MKKRKISPAQTPESGEVEWLHLEDFEDVEITSESATHPIEAALAPGQGWRADAPGEQTIRLSFEQPRTVRQVRVVIAEHERERTQQFVLRAAASDGNWREIARQQFNFSPSGATREQEDYRIELPPIKALELTILPDLNGGTAMASLEQLRVA